MKRKSTYVGLPLIAVLAIGLSTEDTATAEDLTIDDLIEQAAEAEEALGDHFIELEIMTAFDGEEEVGFSRQWMKRDGDVMMTRIETGVEGDMMVIVDDGEEAILYDELNEFAHRLSDEEASIFITTPASYLESISEIYDITIEGTEEVNGREAYHLVLEPGEVYQEFVEEDAVFEVWVDTEYFIVIKQYEEDAMFGNYDSEFVEFEENADIDDELFVLDLPDDIEIVDGLYNFGAEDFDFDFDEEIEFDLEEETEEDADVE